MESVTIRCQQCGKEFTGKSQRAKFCSGACKVKFNRNIRKGSTVTSTPEDVTQNTTKHQAEVTVTDQAFIDDAANRGLVSWYNFDEETFARKCWQCKRAFPTRLKLNRYCSPTCRG